MGLLNNTNHYFLFDLEDYDKLKDIYWVENPNGYIQGINTKTGHKVYLHRLIMDAPQHLTVDHIHHNKLDNRKSELRLATQAQNNINKKSKGVYKSGKKWAAHITRAGVQYSKSFETQEEALEWYDLKSSELSGEFKYEESEGVLMQ